MYFFLIIVMPITTTAAVISEKIEFKPPTALMSLRWFPS